MIDFFEKISNIPLPQNDFSSMNIRCFNIIEHFIREKLKEIEQLQIRKKIRILSKIYLIIQTIY